MVGTCRYISTKYCVNALDGLRNKGCTRTDDDGRPRHHCHDSSSAVQEHKA